MTGRTLRWQMALTASLLMTLVACSTTAEPDAPERPIAEQPAVDSAGTPPSPIAEPGDDQTIADSSSEHSPGASLSVTDLRVAEQNGFDRVVYEFGGAGTPGWSVRYVEQAVQDGSGDVIDVLGQSTLEVSLTGTGYPFDTGVDQYSGPNPLAGSGGITEVNIATVFEGVTQSFIGLDSPQRPVTVSLLSDPVRVVVDVAR